MFVLKQDLCLNIHLIFNNDSPVFNANPSSGWNEYEQNLDIYKESVMGTATLNIFKIWYDEIFFIMLIRNDMNPTNESQGKNYLGHFQI